MPRGPVHRVVSNTRGGPTGAPQSLSLRALAARSASLGEVEGFSPPATVCRFPGPGPAGVHPERDGHVPPRAAAAAAGGTSTGRW